MSDGKQHGNAQPAVAATTEKRPVFNLPDNQMHIIVSGACLAVVYFFLHGCIYSDFVNWDDPIYVTANPLIKDISFSGLYKIFTTAVAGNYHPLTILSYAIENKLLGGAPIHFHLVNLLLHLLVVCLVYWFSWKLSRSLFVAVFTALLFGLHPMHVESFAWISGRKDMLYAAFYFAACIAYLNYIQKDARARGLNYALVVAFFILSLLSKPMAVVLPVSLLLIDLLQQRALNKNLLFEKIPLFIISIVFGLRSVYDQMSIKALVMPVQRSGFFYHAVTGFYALFNYLLKLVFPVELSCFYPYPKVMYLSITVAAAIAVILFFWVFLRKSRVAVFGCLFFLVNIALVLQFIPVGGALIADRYSYVSYFGLFFAIAVGVSHFADRHRNGGIGKTGIAAGLACVLILGVLSMQRTAIWTDSLRLWQDQHDRFPEESVGSQNLGMEYFNRFMEEENQVSANTYADSAYSLLSYAVSSDSSNHKDFLILGDMDRLRGNYERARINYSKIFSINSEFASAADYGLGQICWRNKNLDSSRYYYQLAIRLNNYFPEAHNDYANYLDATGNTDSALAEYALAISQKPQWYAPYLNRGKALQRKEKNDLAQADFSKAIELEPTKGESYYFRSFCFANKDDFAAAKKDIDKAKELGYTQIDTSYYRVISGK